MFILMVGAGGGGSKVDIGTTPLDASAQEVQGTKPVGATPDNPFVIAGTSGGVVTRVEVTSGGFPRVVGATNAGDASAGGGPVLSGGLDSSSLARFLKLDSAGKVLIENFDSTISGVTANVAHSTRSDTFIATGSGVTVTPSSASQSYALQVTGTGATATTWDVRLEASLDGVTFTTILTHTNVTGDGVTIFSGASLSPATRFRSRVAGLVLGGATNIVVQILGQH